MSYDYQTIEIHHNKNEEAIACIWVIFSNLLTRPGDSTTQNCGFGLHGTRKPKMTKRKNGKKLFVSKYLSSVMSYCYF